MLNEGFQGLQSDLCLYPEFRKANSLYLLIYFDDVLSFGNFKTKYITLSINYLRISITQDSNKGITASIQRNISKMILKLHIMELLVSSNFN